MKHKIVYLWRGALMLPPCVILLSVFAGETEVDTLIWPAGLALFALGLILRIWAQMHVKYRLTIRKSLTTTGPYAFVRNPIYIANTLILLAVTVLSELLWFLPVMLSWCILVYTFVVRYEEVHLTEKYGEPYREYVATTPRWLPRPRLNVQPPASEQSLLLESIFTELHCLLYLLPFIGKEIADGLLKGLA